MRPGTPPATGGALATSAAVPFVGREKERASLSDALQEATAGRGAAWIVEGPAGMGKTRLSRWAQETAEEGGFRTLWGCALKEVNTPFFPFQQVFRPPAVARPEDAALPSPLPSVVVFEEEHPRTVLEQAAKLSATHPSLLVVRERQAALRQRLSSLSPSARVLWLSRGEGEGQVLPGDLDTLGHRARTHLESAPGSVVVLTGLDYLTSQNGFGSTLQLVQFLRDSVEETEGHLLLSFNPATFEKRQATLLEVEGYVVRSASSRGAVAGTAETPTAKMLRYLDTLEEEAPRQPVLLVVDDLQWADPDSLRTFRFLARNVRKLPVLLLATLRTDDLRTPEETAETVLTEVLGEMEQEGALRRIDLTGLSPEEAALVATGLFSAPLARGANDEALLEILRRAEGNPFFVMETLRQMADDGHVRRQGDHVALVLDAEDDTVRIPGSLRRLVVRRLERLPQEERSLLEWAAVAGSEFDLAPLHAVAPRSSSSLPEVIERLARRDQLLERRGEVRWAFTHPLLWELTLAELGEDEHARRAKRLADWWSTLRPTEIDTITRLYHDAREPTAGVSWARRAVTAALRAGSLALAVRYHRWMQDLLVIGGSDPDARAREGLSIVEEFFELTGTSGEIVQVLDTLRTLELKSSRRHEVEVYRALGVAKPSPVESRGILSKIREERGFQRASPLVLALLELTLATLWSNTGGLTEAEAATARLRALPEGVPEWVRTRAAYLSGMALIRLNRMPEALARLGELREAAERTSNPRTLGLRLSLEGFLSEHLGMVADYHRVTERALEQARAIGNTMIIADAMSNLDDAFVLEGDLERARGLLKELEKFGERFDLGNAGHLGPRIDGWIALGERRWSTARDLLEKTEEIMERTGYTEQLNLVRLLLVDAYLGTCAADRARATLRAVKSGKEELEAHLRPWVPLAEGRCDLAEGKTGPVREHFESALSLAQTLENVLNQAIATNHLARWEEAFGTPGAASLLRERATVLFDRTGVLAEGWLRAWPPPFPPNKPST